VDAAGPIRGYIEETFSPQEATDAEEDLETFARLRAEVVANAQSPEERRNTLLRYYRALSVVEARFPISAQPAHIRLSFTWCDAFKPAKKASLSNVHFEKAAALFNLGSSWSQHGLTADRATPAGIKTAAHAFQHAAGAFATLRDTALSKVCGGDKGGSGAPTVDLSAECAGMLVALHLAQAQECFFDKAASDGKSPAVCVKLAKQTHNFYEEARSALAAAPLKDHFDRTWLAHTAAKAAAFHAEALTRAAKIAEESDEDIGTAIVRLQVASRELAAGLKAVKGCSMSLTGVLTGLQHTVDESLRRAVRDNECVYMVRVPSPDAVPALAGAAVVKAVPPAPDTLDASAETLFGTIVPESGFKALSKYTELVDALIREENDVLAAASDDARIALREMELPELLIAALAGPSAPPGSSGATDAAGYGAGLPPPLDGEVASIQRAGGVAALRGSIPRLVEINEACTQQIGAAERMLEAEATEDESCRGTYGAAAWTRPASADLTANLRDKTATFRGNLAQASRSDDSLRRRIEDATVGVLSLLYPASLAAGAPQLQAPMISTAEDAAVLPALRAALEALQDVGAERADIEDAMKRTKENDNIMSKVMASTDSYDALFDAELAKYEGAKAAIAGNVSSQASILSQLRGHHAVFVATYDVAGWRAAVSSHTSAVRDAVEHFRELASGLEKGLTFYSGFLEVVRQLGADCEEFAERRRGEKGQLEAVVAHRAHQAAAVVEHQAAATAAAQRAAADQAAAQRAMAEAQAMMQTQRAQAMSMAAQQQQEQQQQQQAAHQQRQAAEAAQQEHQQQQQAAHQQRQAAEAAQQQAAHQQRQAAEAAQQQATAAQQQQQQAAAQQAAAAAATHMQQISLQAPPPVATASAPTLSAPPGQHPAYQQPPSPQAYVPYDHSQSQAHAQAHAQAQAQAQAPPHHYQQHHAYQQQLIPAQAPPAPQHYPQAQAAAAPHAGYGSGYQQHSAPPPPMYQQPSSPSHHSQQFTQQQYAPPQPPPQYHQHPQHSQYSQQQIYGAPPPGAGQPPPSPPPQHQQHYGHSPPPPPPPQGYYTSR
jgi:programmed cell death 6-interacting protein